MMNRLLKRLIFSFFLAFFLIYSNLSSAISIRGKIVDGSVQWTNAIYQEGYLTLSKWQMLSGLTPTKSWKPGSYLAVSGVDSGNIVLSYSSSSVSIPFRVSGTQYNLGSSANKFKISDSGGSFIECPESSLSPNMAYATGEGSCVSVNEYDADVAVTPFQFARPLLKFDNTDIIDAFNDPTLPKGRYSGEVTVTPMYMFKTSSGSWTYRTSSPIPLNIVINYQGAQTFDFNVIGDGIITPIYNRESETITGTTHYQVKFKGNFPKGSKIQMTLLKPTSGKFELLADDKSVPEDKNRIPYSIMCRGDACHDSLLVDFSGKSVLDDDSSYLESFSDSKEMSINLDIGYKHISRSSVATGRYSNSFTIIFENEM
ncbi:TPA: hypothetical protein ACX6SG_003809 [Photobacterium damselae]